MTRKRVYIANTGGTIGMRRENGSYRPAPGYLAERMEGMPELRDPSMPEYDIHEYVRLLDSSDMEASDWVAIGRDIASVYDHYDGFVVIHGTDTMAYTAAALSYMFEDLGKPIVLTGSQIPLAEVRSDARENLITSLMIAADTAIPEVCLFLGERILRGNRATKVNATGLRAFDSPNYPALGTAGVEIQVDPRLVFLRPDAPTRFIPIDGHPNVADVRLFPGITPSLLERFFTPPLDGAVLHTYGVGNAPSRPEFVEVIANAVDRGVVVVNCTQCLRGRVYPRAYATGDALTDAGVISGHDMNPEAALTKLLWLLSLGLDRDEVERGMGKNLRGELTESSVLP
ncbi:MAG: asparaginase [Acidobacteriota bacterium]